MSTSDETRLSSFLPMSFFSWRCARSLFISTSEMAPVSWPEFAGMHPLCPPDQAAGYRAMIESLNLEELTCRAAVLEIAKMLHQVHDDLKDKAFELEMSWICEESGRKHQLVPQDVLDEAETAAKAALDSDDSDDDDDDDGEVAMAD